jgi:uncharacterized iron-regulated membrane protein
VERRKPRPVAFWLHNVFGLKISLFLAFVCLTGTIATVAHELEWLYKPEVRATAFEPGREDWAGMWAAAQRAFPEATLTGIGPYDRTDASYFAKSVSATDATGREFTIYVDPGTGAVTGHEYGRSLQDVMRGLHYYLFVPGDAGFYLVTVLGFPLLGSLITGLIVYKKFWRGFFRRPRTDRAMRTLMGDLHRLAGLWASWFVAVIALTSIYYFFERGTIDWETPPPEVARASAPAPVTAARIAAWVALAREAKPGISITAVYLPYSETEPVTVQGHWRAALVRERADAVFIDPATGQIVGQRTAHEMAVGERIVHTVDPLHFGTFGGLATRLLWAAFGLLLTGLAGTGAYIYAKRTRLAVRDGVNLSFLNYLGRWKWPSIAAIAIVPSIAFLSW